MRRASTARTSPASFFNSRTSSNASLPRTLETTEYVALGKTVSLIRLALALPALLGGVSERELLHLDRIARFWGLGYQIVDDLKDVLQSAGESGKTPARDALLKRPNIAAVIGVHGAVLRLARLIDLGDKALARILQMKPELEFLEQLRNGLQSDLECVGRDAFALAEACGQ